VRLAMMTRVSRSPKRKHRAPDLWTTSIRFGMQLPVRLYLDGHTLTVRLPWPGAPRRAFDLGATIRRDWFGLRVRLSSTQYAISFLWPGTGRVVKTLVAHGCSQAPPSTPPEPPS
jgi:hypothetical protein